MVRASLIVVVIGLAACGGPPKKPEIKPQPRPIAVADLDGEWRSTDIDGWTYELAIHGPKYQQTINRTSGGPCVQQGTLQSYEALYGAPYVPPHAEQEAAVAYGGATYGGPAAAPHTLIALILTLEQNACNPDYAGAQLIVVASEFDGDRITLRTGAGYGGAEESHRYERFVATPVAPAK